MKLCQQKFTGLWKIQFLFFLYIQCFMKCNVLYLYKFHFACISYVGEIKEYYNTIFLISIMNELCMFSVQWLVSHFCFYFQDKLNKITVFGAGLLVGTALTVIIPEGIRSLIPEVNHHAHNQSEGNHVESDPFSVIGISLVLGFIFMLLVDQVSII